MLHICLSSIYNRLCTGSRFTRLLLTAVMPLMCLTLHAQQDTVQGVIRQDYEALAAIYEALGGRFWTSENEEEPYPTCYFNDWMTFVPVNDWYGVTVENSRVVKLILANNRLYDQLPNAIGNLTALRELVLKDNAIHGAIPATIANITTLEKLDLSHNHFDQPVPSGIFAMPNLKELILNDNHIPGPLTIAQPATTSLQKLRLENNVLTGSIPNNIGSLTQLKSLRLSNNEISGPIPASFRNLTLLDSVYIQFNNIDAINPAYLKGSYLVFDCSNNNLDFGDLAPLNVTGKPWLNYAPQKDLGTIEAIGKQTGNSYTLQGMDYRAGNRYQWFRWSHINNNTDWQPVGTNSNHSLNSLNKNNDEATYRCVITNTSVPNLEIYTKPAHIYVDYKTSIIDFNERYYIELVKLFLSTNGLPWRGIYEGWTNRTNWLNSTANIRGWYGVGNGDALSLSENKLKGVLPESFRILTEKFKFFQLSYNDISGKLPEYIEDIRQFILIKNKLTGKIPASFFDNKINSLNLDENNLYGELPSNIVLNNYSPSNKIQLTLSNNEFYGKIPQWQVVCRFTLQLYNNKLSGMIPNTTFKNLEYATFDNNYFTGWGTEISDSFLWFCSFINNNISGYLSINHIKDNLILYLRHNYINKLTFYDENLASSEIAVGENKLTFESFFHILNTQIDWYSELKQRNFGETKKILRPEGSLLIHNLGIDNSIADNVYKWYKYNTSYTNPTLIYQSNINKLVIDSMTVDKQGIYYCVVTNPRLPYITLRSRPILIEISDCEVPQSEIDILLELRNTNGGISTQQWSLDINSDVSQWPGVTVENCHVTGIHLPNEGLTGVLPESLCNLEYLNSVDFSGNPGLLSPVPPCVCQLMNLYYNVSISHLSLARICPGGSIVLQASIANASPADFRYHWYDPSGNLLKTATGDPVIALTNVTTASLGEYRVEVESLSEELSCSGSGGYTIDTSIFREPSTVTISRPSPARICPGGSIVLQASVTNANTANFRYHWYDPSGNLLGTVTGDPLFKINHITAATLGKYRLEVETLSEFSCGGSGSYTIDASIFRGPLSVTISRPSSALICPGGSITLQAAVTDANPADCRFRWYDPSGKLLKTTTGDPVIALTNVTTASLGEYRVEVESLSEELLCSGSGGYTIDTSIFREPSTVTISRPSPARICPGGSIVLQASIANANPANFRYRWYDPSGNLLGTVTGDPLFEVYHITSATLGEYRVDVESLSEQLSCGGSGAYTVDGSVFHPLPVIRRVGSGSVCSGGSVTLRASVAGINPDDLTYRWYNSAGNLLKTATGDPLIQITNVTAASMGTYRVEVESLSGLLCGSGAYTLNVSFYALPTVSVTDIVHTSCADTWDGSANISVTGISATYTYQVFDAGGIIRATANNYISGRVLPVTGISAGVYTIRGTTSAGCKYTKTFEIRNGGPVVELCLPPLPCDIQAGQTIAYTFRFMVKRLKVHARSYNYYITDGKVPPPVNALYDVWVTHTINYVHGRNYTLVLNDCSLRVPLEITPLRMSIIRIKDEYRRCYPSQPLNITGGVSIPFPRCMSLLSPEFNATVQLYSVAANGRLTLLQTQFTQGLSISLPNFTHPAGKYLLRVTGLVMDANKVTYGTCTAEHHFTVTANNLSVAVDVTDELCPNEKNGSATARVSGGTPPYEYFWYRGTTLVSTGATVQGLAPGSYTLRVKDALPCDVTAGATAFTVRAAAAIGNITVTVPSTSSPDCAVTATLQNARNGERYRFEWMRIVPSTDPLSPAREVTVLTDDVTAAACVATSVTNLNTIRPGFEYYVVVTDTRGCRKSTRGQNKPGMVVRPVVQRDYALYFRWQSEEEMDDTPPAPPPAVNDRAALAASDIKRKFEDAPLECAAEAQLKVETRFGDYCTAIEYLHDELEIKYRTRAGHFTLYYYDRAGNLSKTVPPAGIRPCTNPAAWAGHTMVTEYRHNTLGQVVWQRTPDAGESRFLYDGAGRLRFSQSAQQAVDNKFSYTKYDELGRPRETGQGTFGRQDIPYTNWDALAAASSTLYAAEQNQPLAQRFPASTVAEPVVEYRTITRYDETAATWNSRPQRYTLNRISSVEHRNPGFLDVTGKPVTYEPVTTRYSYDPHGNVEWTTTDIPGLGARGTEYEYDLVSGNVTQVAYDRGYVDQFFHRYRYDEDNRLVTVQTSDNGDLWETEANYDYYAHGPLKRTEVGNDRLQGIDYVYTLQGWLKAINHSKTGNDGINTPADLFGMVLTYYNADYANSHSTIKNNALLPDANRQLYNGNIAAWAWRTPPLNGLGYADSNTKGQKFVYDRLNRLKSSQFYDYNNTSGWQITNQYLTAYGYDANGNILSLNRNEAKNGQAALMDALNYKYEPGTNRLDHVLDRVSDTVFDHDIDSQPQGNYYYDESGNLIFDQHERQSISWTPSGKVGLIKKADGSIITFLYDATGNRVVKKVNNIRTHTETAATFYVPDARGNIMATYNRTVRYNPESQPVIVEFRLGEQPLYGSGRLGVRSTTYYRVRVEIRDEFADEMIIRDNFTAYRGLATRTLGRKQYELTDHLGNVRVVFNDRITGTLQANTLSPNILATNSYYPYGMLIKSLSQNSETYRWGFQGHEQDNEIKGTGNHLKFGDYGYDTRLGRRWNLDPVDQIGISNYAVFGNNPIRFVDPDGKVVKPAGTEELIMIQNTLPKDARDYVRLNNNGLIDQQLLNSYSGENLNFNNLKTLVNSDRTLEIKLDDKFIYAEQNGQLAPEPTTMKHIPFDTAFPEDKDLKGETINGLSTGEGGFMGKTLFPDRDGIQNSPNENIIVIINKHLSPAGAAETYSHEANGHALLYILNGNDHKGASHQPVNDSWLEGNKTLMNMIINSKKETIKNMQEK